MQNDIDLIVPGLCGPLPELTELHQSKALSSFVSLLGKASRHKTQASTYPEQLCSSMGVRFNPVPDAELSLLAYGINSEGYHWMHADPVHLLADVDHAVLYDSNSLNLNDEESNVLVSDLNQHFKADEIEFVVVDANHWFIKSKKDINVVTRCLNDAIMQNINQLMPTGKGGSFCKQLMNESQMLLYANPLNETRESNGLLTVNSLWFWGEGTLNRGQESDVARCFGNDVLLKGLANYLDVDCDGFDTAETIMTKIMNNGKNLIVVDDLITACNYGDVSNWLSSFEAMVMKTLSPLIAYALKNKLQIHCYPCNGYRYTINSKLKYRFWRSGKLEEYFAIHE